MEFTHQLYFDCHCKSAVIMSLYNHNFAIIPPSESPGYPDTTTASCSWMPLVRKKIYGKNISIHNKV